MAKLYRVESVTPRPTSPASPSLRPPGNVPYVIDNLWEWARPAGLPSRRGCAYASPTPELAWQNAKHRPDNQLVALRFRPEAVVVQASVDDARYHPDCQPALRQHLFELLGGRQSPSLPVAQKLAAAPLFLPTLSRNELNELLGAGGALAAIADELRPLITFWNTVRRVDLSADTLPSPTGEVFFSTDAVESKDPV